MEEIDEMKRHLLTTAFALLGISLLVGNLAFVPRQARAAANAQVTPEPEGTIRRTVSVTGTGSVEATPDMAVVILGVQTDAESASEALNQNNTQMNALIAALRSAGVAEADIQTQNLQLYPRYEEPPAQPQQGTSQAQLEIIGYTAINNVEVRVRDLDNLGDLLDQAVTAGSNQINGIRFDVQNQTTQLDQAREAAVQDAARKARQLAQLANAQLGPVVSIQENTRYPLPFQAEAAALDQAGSAVPIAPGQQSLMVDVYVTWELVVSGGAAGGSPGADEDAGGGGPGTGTATATPEP